VTTPGTDPAATGYPVAGVSLLDEYVLLGDAGLAMAMVAAGAERLVNPRGIPVHGQPTYTSVADLPGPVDLAFVMVPRHRAVHRVRPPPGRVPGPGAHLAPTSAV
jgi:hypothetical protein